MWEAELDAAANQVVPLGFQELVQQSSCDLLELLLQTGRLTATQTQTDDVTEAMMSFIYEERSEPR